METVYDLLSKVTSVLAKLVPSSVTNAVGHDKVTHFLVGLLVSCLFALLHLFVGLPVVLTFIMPAVAGVVKELLDFVKNKIAISKGSIPLHGVEFADVVATALGALPVLLLYFVVLLLLV